MRGIFALPLDLCYNAAGQADDATWRRTHGQSDRTEHCKEERMKRTRVCASVALVAVTMLSGAALLGADAEKAKFEPPDGKVLHGAGQSPDAFDEYYELLKDTPPAIYMIYAGLRPPRDHAAWHEPQTPGEEQRAKVISHIPGKLAHYVEKYPDLIPQIGMDFVGFDDAVAAGRCDDQIRAGARYVKTLRVPVFIRPGFEFNARGRGYGPEHYPDAFRSIVDIYREEGTDNVAFVWCYLPARGRRDGPSFMDYYPGDDYVDWWSTDLFAVGSFWRESNLAFLEEARKHGKPVMIAESTPQFVGVTDGHRDWTTWFETYFRFIELHPNIKAFCYINWDWSKYKQWNDWGEARLSQNEAVLRSYRREMKSERYLHASHGIFAALGYEPPPAESE